MICNIDISYINKKINKIRLLGQVKSHNLQSTMKIGRNLTYIWHQDGTIPIIKARTVYKSIVTWELGSDAIQASSKVDIHQHDSLTEESDS